MMSVYTVGTVRKANASGWDYTVGVGIFWNLINWFYGVVKLVYCTYRNS